jgi:hypothetical protein
MIALEVFALIVLLPYRLTRPHRRPNSVLRLGLAAASILSLAPIAPALSPFVCAVLLIPSSFDCPPLNTHSTLCKHSFIIIKNDEICRCTQMTSI